jgi:hypothetical protein
MEILAVRFERRVQADVEAVRRAAFTALRGMKFVVDKSQGSYAEAHSGASWFPRPGVKARPMRARLSIFAQADRTCLQMQLTDSEPVVVDVAAARRAYEELFNQVCHAIDGELSRLDPELERRSSAIEARADELGARAQVERLGRVIRRRLGPPSDKDDLRLYTSEVAVTMPVAEAELCLSVASITLTDPGLPDSLVTDLREVERLLRDALHSHGVTPDVAVTDRQQHIVDFLHRQAKVRLSLPVRELHRCQDCGYEKIVNPDYQRLLSRNRGLRQLAGIAVSTMAMPHTAPFAIAGRLMNMQALGNKFTCVRCQGTHADVHLVTICLTCKQIVKDPVLRTCPTEDCGRDFTAHSDDALNWTAALT